MTRQRNHVEIERELDSFDPEPTGTGNGSKPTDNKPTTRPVMQLAPDEPADRALRNNDVDNSTRFIRLHGDRVRHVIEWDTWIVWDGTHWVVDRSLAKVYELAKAVSSELYREAANSASNANETASWAKASATRNHIASMVLLARDIEGVPISADDLDADPWLLGVANGYINLRNGTFHAPDPDKLMTMQAPVTYDPNAQAPRWQQALTEWFPDEEVRRYVQRLSGHAIAGDPLGDHIFVIHYGDGRNGKGTFMRSHKNVLGPYYVTPDKSLLIQKRYDQHATVKARLFRKRLAVASETGQTERLNEAQVKNLTGRDPINARRMREDEWEFMPNFSFWLQTNHLPRIDGVDNGIWPRIKVVPWTESFYGRAEGNLDDILASEAAGILNWMIDGCLKWQSEGLDEPDAIKRATLDYQATEDVLSRFATETGLVFAKDQTVIDRDLKERITEWAREETIDKPDAKKINSWMTANGCNKRRQNYTNPDNKPSKRNVWKGVGFTRPTDQTARTLGTLATTEETT